MSETRKQLKALIAEYKQCAINGRRVAPAVEEKLYRQLEVVYYSRNTDEVQKDLGVIIERHDNLNDKSNLLALINFKRLSTVYNRGMYNKFLLPIWAAAVNKDRSVGYILYPRLVPLREVLQDLRDAGLDFESYTSEVNKVLRVCIAPIALAIDAIHTEVSNKRTMYYHRDVCMDNIYMSVQRSVDSKRKETVVYDDARLKLTELTKGSNQEYIDVNRTISPKPLFRQYHHHTDLKKGGTKYHRRHDWNSFGVYILEVLHLLLPMVSKADFQQTDDYFVFADDFKEHIEALRTQNVHLKRYILQYLDVAVTCLNLNENKKLVTSLEMPPTMTGRTESITFHFEYGLSQWTAELLWIYEDARRDDYKAYEHKQRKTSLCQACLLCPTGDIPTKIHSRSDRPKCTTQCVYYCARCYRNGERKFCTNKHGTTSTIIGGQSSYALLLYGEEFKHPDIKNPCKRSAYMVENTLRHNLICGIPKSNILVRPLYDVTKKDGKKTTLSAVAALKQHCEEMRQLMHGEDSITCANDAEYRMFILYCGHGHGKEHPGDWCPTESEVITKLERDAFLESLWQCTKSSKGQAECESSCVMVSYFMEHCYTEAELPKYVQNAAASTSYRGAATEYGTELAGEEGGLPDICRWLCQLLRSAFHEGCTGSKKGVEDSACLVKIGRTDVCSQLRTRISDVCMDAYIDGACLMIHKDHMHPNCGFYTAIDVVCVRNEKFPLAYYNPGGVYLTVFPYSEDHGKVKELAFDCKMTRTKIKKEIAKELDSKSDHICLLTNCTDDYSKYELVCDFNLNDVLYSSVLFYHVVSQPVEVTLRATNTDGTGLQMEDTIILPLEDADLHPLIAECYKPGERLPFPQLECLPRKSYLPNITVHIVHYLRYLKKETKTDETASTTNQATDSEQSSESSAKDHFIRQLCGSSVDTQKLSEDQWQKIEEIAMKYVIEKRTDFTVRQPLNTTAKLSIEWTATQPTAAKLTPGLTEEENEDVGALEPENKAVITDANATHSSQPVDALASQTSISATSDDDDTLPSLVENHLIISSLTDDEDSV